MNIEFDFVITGTGEAVFLIGGEHRIYDIKGVNSLHSKHQNDNDVLMQLNIARAALFEDAVLPIK